MLRTAEQIMNDYLGGNMNISTLKPIAFYEMINIARIEAIKECSEKAYNYYEPLEGFNETDFYNDLIKEVK